MSKDEIKYDPRKAETKLREVLVLESAMSNKDVGGVLSMLWI